MSELTMFDALFSSKESKRRYYEAGILVDVCEKLHKLMDERGMKRKDIAEALDVSASQVSQWFAGKASMQLKTVASILYAMDLKFTGFDTEEINSQLDLTTANVIEDNVWFERVKQTTPQACDLVTNECEGSLAA